MTAERIFLDIFIFGLGAYVMAGLRTLRRDSERERRPDNPADEPAWPYCPQCGERYRSWAFAPPRSHELRCPNGHEWAGEA